MNKRILTGLILGALILLCIYAGNKYTAYLLMAINVLGAYELSKMLRPLGRTPVTYAHILLAVVPYFLLDLVGSALPIFNILLVLSVVSSLILMALLYYNGVIPFAKWSYVLAFIYWGLPYCLGTYYLINSDQETNLVALAVILLIWTSDTMAYFTGKRFGKTKLFESVSPNKTREGSFGAGLSILVLSILIGWVAGQELVTWIGIGLTVWIAGTYGDLVESKMKRAAAVKDSGKLLPGHGGFLDRFDSLVMVIPFLLLLTRLA